jgi:sortase A
VRAYARPFAAILAVAGMAVFGWVAVTLVWGEPFSAITTSRAQGALRVELAEKKGVPAPADRAESPADLRRRAAALGARLREGDAVGTIVVPRLGLRMVVVEGTSASQLARGPGRYRMTSLPGLGGTVAIAGHRTTHLQPFRHLDALRSGDSIYLEMPYGTFRYVVYAGAIVDDRDWSILRPRPFEKLVLSACHPLYSASQRIIVYARPPADSPRTAGS